jgi:subtilase family serine protease
MNGQGVSYQSERAWNWGFVGSYGWNPDGYVGTSGGISTTVNIPSWQKGISMVANHGSTTMRNVPDVALTADNVFVVSSGGSFGNFGGTSCASPLFAGFMALVNQQAAANSKPSIGFWLRRFMPLPRQPAIQIYFMIPLLAIILGIKV